MTQRRFKRIVLCRQGSWRKCHKDSYQRGCRDGEKGESADTYGISIHLTIRKRVCAVQVPHSNTMEGVYRSTASDTEVVFMKRPIDET